MYILGHIWDILGHIWDILGQEIELFKEKDLHYVHM